MKDEATFERDLAVLVPDPMFAGVVRALLGRSESLSIRPIRADIYLHPHHDPGCLRGSAGFPRPFSMTRAHALVLFDRSGCGQENSPATDLENKVREALSRSGWDDRAEAVVVDPELEVWAWSDSPQVDQALGWTGRQPALRGWLAREGLWNEGEAKPEDPKRALQRALDAVQGGALPAVLVQLAKSVGLGRCTDRAFGRFRDILRRWFPAS